jgi:RNA polymerase sigma-70 factor (ECF subfamily)
MEIEKNKNGESGWQATDPDRRARNQLSAAPRVIVQEATDWELVQRHRLGDRAAFAELMTRYQRPVYNAAFGVLHRIEDAKDITQDVFLKVAERLDEYDPQFKFFSWIYRIALNESLNLQRRNHRNDPREVETCGSASEGADPEEQAGDAERAKRIRSALMRMSDGDRTVLSLRHFSECSYETIGQILGVDQKTVKSRLFESRQRLRGLLEDMQPS